MKFLVDAPLGGLAKLLRFLGFDTMVVRLKRRPPPSLPPPAPGVYVLTAQPPLARLRRPDLLVLRAAAPEAQLAETLDRLGISRSRIAPLSRCSRCNEVLRPVSREQVRGRVPEYIAHAQDRFSECPRCRRVYWPGSHLTRLARKLKVILPEANIARNVDETNAGGRED